MSQGTQSTLVTVGVLLLIGLYLYRRSQRPPRPPRPAATRIEIRRRGCGCLPVLLLLPLLAAVGVARAQPGTDAATSAPAPCGTPANGQPIVRTGTGMAVDVVTLAAGTYKLGFDQGAADRPALPSEDRIKMVALDGTSILEDGPAIFPFVDIFSVSAPSRVAISVAVWKGPWTLTPTPLH